MNNDTKLKDEIEEMFADIQEAHREDIIADFSLDVSSHIVTNKRHPFYKLKKNFEPWEIAVRALAVSGFVSKAHKCIVVPTRNGKKLVSKVTMLKKAKEISRKFDEVFGEEAI